MPKQIVDNRPKIKCQWYSKGKEPGCYCLHSPSECKHRFPADDQPIHKCSHPRREVLMVPQGTGFRRLIVPRPPPTLYPAVMPLGDYQRLREQARIVTQEETLAAMTALEQRNQEEARQSEARKERLKQSLRPQPGAALAAGKSDLEGPDKTAHTLNRAEVLKDEETAGPRLASRVILGTKCHAIRDAQLVEKEVIKKALTAEEKRLDNIMEENRLAAINRAESTENYRHQLRLSNLEALKLQIQARHTAKILEAERIEEESIRINQANIVMQMDEARKLAEKHERQAKLKEMLDQGNAEILYYKQLQNEEERISDLRVQQFLKARQEREAKNRAEADAVKAAKEKGIEYISKAQKAEQELKEELERIRNLKIQEDVEREYRRKERDAAIKRNQQLRDLHESRAQQISDIHRLIACEIAKDEQAFNNAARQNEQYMAKEKAIEDKRKLAIEKHRREIMKQINDKEKKRAEDRATTLAQGTALRLERDQADARERRVVKAKIEAMREQKVPEQYVREAEMIMAKHGY